MSLRGPLGTLVTNTGKVDVWYSTRSNSLTEHGFGKGDFRPTLAECRSQSPQSACVRSRDWGVETLAVKASNIARKWSSLEYAVRLLLDRAPEATLCDHQQLHWVYNLNPNAW